MYYINILHIFKRDVSVGLTSIQSPKSIYHRSLITMIKYLALFVVLVAIAFMGFSLRWPVPVVFSAEPDANVATHTTILSQFSDCLAKSYHFVIFIDESVTTRDHDKTELRYFIPRIFLSFLKFYTNQTDKIKFQFIKCQQKI